MIEDIELDWIANEIGDIATLRAQGIILTFDRVMLTVESALEADLEKAAKLPPPLRTQRLSERYGFDAATLVERLRALDADGRAWLIAQIDQRIMAP